LPNFELFFTGVSTGADLTGVLIQGCQKWLFSYSKNYWQNKTIR